MANILKEPCNEGVVEASPETACSIPSASPWILAATIIGSSMVFMDGTLVNVALPAMQRELNATGTELQWIVESYALFLAALILMGGSLGDRYGHRRIFAAGVVVFTVASLWCGLSGSAPQLIIARGLQGIGGALMVPGSLAIISASFCDEQRGRAIGTWSGFTAMTTAFGPVIGGWLVEHVSWRWAFFVNLPFALVVLAILYHYVPETRNEESARLDVWGAVLATLGLGALVYGLIESANIGFTHPVVVGTLALGSFSLAAFVRVQARGQTPMMPLPLFRSRTFSGANVLTLLLYAALGGSLYFLPFNLIQVQGYSATEAGAAYLPFILLMFLLSRWSGGLVYRYGAKLPLTLGPVIAAAGYVLLAAPAVGGSYWSTFFPGIAVLGLGMAISVAPLTTTVMGSVAQRHAGIASGINNGVSRTAALIAIAGMGIFIVQAYNTELDDRLAKLDLSPAVLQTLDAERARLAGAQPPADISAELGYALKSAIAESYVSGFRLIMFIAAGLALASALSAWLMIEDRRPVRA